MQNFLANKPDNSVSKRYRSWIYGLAALGITYYATSYLVVPIFWRYNAHHHPALTALATRTVTKDGIPGDPINITLIGDNLMLERSLLGSGWVPADPTTIAAALRITADSVLHRPYNTAPVSNLYFWGRKQDLVFEQMIGGDPRRRHHVRFWKSTEVDPLGHPLWVGAATLDTRAGISHTTGQITHHIDAAIDTERDKLVADLSPYALAVDWIDTFQTTQRGRNGGGDPFETDRRLALVTLK